MITASALSKLSEPDLRAWILARMRGHEDPPVASGRMEGPDDFVRLVHHEARDATFRARLEKAALGALREVARGDLVGPDADALRHLAALMDGLDLRTAVPVLKAIAERGAFGGHEGELDPDAEGMVLFALASLQPPGKLWPKWEALWQQDLPRLWPVVSAGMRLSAPERALNILPDAVQRGSEHQDFPLGEVLWAFATYDNYTETEISHALNGLSPELLTRCREALTTVGATPEEIDAWVPSSCGDWPAWACRSNRTQVPSFAEVLACP